MKRLILVFCLVFLIGLISSQNLEMNLDKEDYLPGEIIKIIVNIKNIGHGSVEILFQGYLQSNNPSVPIPRIYQKLLKLDPGETKNFEYEIDTELINYDSTYEIVGEIYDNNSELIGKKINKFNLINASKPMVERIIICRGNSCDKEANIFLQDETVYFDYVSEINDVKVSGKLINPKGNSENVSIPLIRKFDETGTYQIEIKFDKEGYESKVELVQFGIIDDHAKVKNASLPDVASSAFTGVGAGLILFLIGVLIIVSLVIVIILLVMHNKRNNS